VIAPRNLVLLEPAEKTLGVERERFKKDSRTSLQAF
jgi:hypothetical protein